MDKGLLFLILGFSALWLVMDEFTGKKRLTLLSELMTPDLSIGNVITEKADEIKDKVTEKVDEIKEETKDKTLDAGQKLDKFLPWLFFSPRNKKDKEKVEEKKNNGKSDSLFELWKDSVPGKVY